MKSGRRNWVVAGLALVLAAVLGGRWLGRQEPLPVDGVAGAVVVLRPAAGDWFGCEQVAWARALQRELVPSTWPVVTCWRRAETTTGMDQAARAWCTLRGARALVWSAPATNGPSQWCVTFGSYETVSASTNEFVLSLHEWPTIRVPGNSPAAAARLLFGYRHFRREEFAAATVQFQEAEPAGPDLLFWRATTRWCADTPTNATARLDLCRRDLDAVLAQTDERTAPALWAAAQNNLGMIWASLAKLGATNAYEQAGACYTAALRVKTETDWPLDWARTQANLGAWRLHWGARYTVAELEQARDHFHSALRILTEREHPLAWAILQRNLAYVHGACPVEQRAAEFPRAIECLCGALRVYTVARFPERWARLQYDLGECHRLWPGTNATANADRAIEHYRAALHVRTLAAMPEASAETWLGLAQACADRAGTTDAGFQEEALAACERALQVFTETNHLALWSQTHSILAAVYSDRLTGDRESNLQQSIAHRAATLRFYQFERNPLHWAITHLELGAAYRNLRGPGYTDNQRRAADHCRQALRVFTRAQQPRDWAAAHGHLAAIAVDGPGPDAATTALAHLAAAAQVITRETAPADWAVLQFNEAEAYRRLNRGDRLDNLRQAVSRYPHALLTPGVTRPSRDQVLSQFSIAVTDLAREAQRRRDRAALVWCADLIRAVQRQLSPGPPGDATRLRYLQNQLDQMLAVLPAAP